jgi:hypothetical protein
MNYVLYLYLSYVLEMFTNEFRSRLIFSSSCLIKIGLFNC